MGQRRRRKGARRSAQPRRPDANGTPEVLEQREEAVVASGDEPASKPEAPVDPALRSVAADDDDATEERVTDPGPAPAEGVRVRVDYADTPRSPALVLVPPAPEPADGDDEREPPRRAADALPPRNRRATEPIDPITEPRGRRFDFSAASGTGAGEAPEGPNKRPSGAPKPAFGQPLFAQDWGTAPSGTPTWKPGAPPADPSPSRAPMVIVGVTALVGVAMIVLWLAIWWA